MKKLLLLLALPALSMQANSQELDDLHVHGANIEMIVPYQHPVAKKVGDKMPLTIGTWAYEMDMFISGINKERRDIAQITCHGKDKDREIIETVKDSGPITGDDKNKEKIIFGLIIGYDRNPEDGKRIAEYEVVQRRCDIEGELKNFSGYLPPEQYNIPFGVYDTGNRIFYVDAVKRDGIIDAIVSCGGANSLANAVLYLPICKED